MPGTGTGKEKKMYNRERARLRMSRSLVRITGVAYLIIKSIIITAPNFVNCANKHHTSEVSPFKRWDNFHLIFACDEMSVES